MTRLLALSIVVGALVGCSRTGTGAGVRADITAQMQSVQSPIQQCYATALQVNRRIRGMMVVNFRATAGTGLFDQVNLGRNEPGDATLSKCVVEQVSHLKLTTPQRTALSIAYPIRFEPTK